MAFNKHQQDNICHMSMAGDIKIYDAVNYKHEMFTELETYRAIKLDLSEVEEIDASGFQLLILLRKEARQRGISFDLVGMSTPVIKLLELYRLGEWFQSQD